MDKKIVLASQSPRRKQLLEMAEIAFEIQVADIDETPPTDMPAEEVPEHLAKEKAAVIAAKNPGATIIAADTVVILNGEILNKPEDEADAINILKKLSGNMHRVVSGVCIQHGDTQDGFSVTTEVYFRPLTEEQIKHYVTNYKPFDKAGAYAIQEWIGIIGIEKIVGDYYNVMGLPIGDVVRRLID
ncbi:MAG: septum formation protein Maf [Chitinophagales bacterium]|nr:septum formation protein Maf [Chitinophagaceae bacterium]MCB9065978.1 septum formation protein Maf [Chitinophagales bacterium]